MRETENHIYIFSARKLAYVTASKLLFCGVGINTAFTFGSGHKLPTRQNKNLEATNQLLVQAVRPGKIYIVPFGNVECI